MVPVKWTLTLKKEEISTNTGKSSRSLKNEKGFYTDDKIDWQFLELACTDLHDMKIRVKNSKIHWLNIKKQCLLQSVGLFQTLDKSLVIV